MASLDYTTTILVDQSPEEVFRAINNVPAWWNDGMTGKSEKLNDEFEVRFGDMHYSKQRLTEVVPNKKVVWLVTDSSLSFLEDKTEWTGTTISFEISTENGKTKIRLTHTGLVPTVECYNACAPAWTLYMQNSLYYLITKGKGQPGFPPEHPLL